MPGFQSDDDFAMDFSDHLFNTLLQPNIIDFPNPREIGNYNLWTTIYRLWMVTNFIK